MHDPASRGILTCLSRIFVTCNQGACYALTAMLMHPFSQCRLLCNSVIWSLLKAWLLVERSRMSLLRAGEFMLLWKFNNVAPVLLLTCSHSVIVLWYLSLNCLTDGHSALCKYNKSCKKYHYDRYLKLYHCARQKYNHWFWRCK